MVCRIATFLLYRKMLAQVRRLTEVSCIWYGCTWEASVTVWELAWYDRVSQNELQDVQDRVQKRKRFLFQP